MVVTASKSELEDLWRAVVEAASPEAVVQYEKLLANITVERVDQVKTQCFIYDDHYFLSLIWYIRSSPNTGKRQKKPLSELLANHADQIAVSASDLRKLLKFERPLGFHNVPAMEPGSDMLMFQFRSSEENTMDNG